MKTQTPTNNITLPRQFRREVKKRLNNLRYPFMKPEVALEKLELLYGRIGDVDYENFVRNVMSLNVYDYRNDMFEDLINHLARVFGKAYHFILQDADVIWEKKPLFILTDGHMDISPNQASCCYTFKFILGDSPDKYDFKISIGHNEKNLVISAIDSKIQGLPKHFIDYVQGFVRVMNSDYSHNLDIELRVTEELSNRQGPKLTKDQKVNYFMSRGFSVTTKTSNEIGMTWSSPRIN